MNSVVAFFTACLAATSAGYIEHYQGATSFSSFDLKSSTAAGNRLIVSRPTVTYGGGVAIKGSTDHAAHSKVVTYETKPVISAVYTAPITKTVTYTGAPIQYASSHHYVAPSHGSECALKEGKIITPVHTALSHVAPASAYPITPAYTTSSSKDQPHLATQTVPQGYPPAQTQYKHVYSQISPHAPNTGSVAISHAISHQLATPGSSGLYTPSKDVASYGTVSSKESFSSGHGQISTFGAHPAYLQPAPIAELLVDVAPPKKVNAQLSAAYGEPALTDTNYLSYPAGQPVVASHEANAGYATSHQSDTAYIPVKPARHYLAPLVGPVHSTSGASSTAGSAAWSGSASIFAQNQYARREELAKQTAHSYTTTHSHSAPVVPTQQYLPSQGTVVAPVSTSGSAPAPDREYLPPREYLPAAQEQKGSTVTGGNGAASYEVPLRLTSSNHHQQGIQHTGSSAVPHISYGTAEYGRATIVSPMHVTVPKTPVLVSIPKSDCTQHHQLQ